MTFRSEYWAMSDPKYANFLFEGGLAICVGDQYIRIYSAQLRNQLERSSQPLPGGIQFAGILPNALIPGTEQRRTIGEVLLNERVAVEDANDIVGEVSHDRIHSHLFEPCHVLSDDGGVRAIVAPADGNHVGRLKNRHRSGP
jgi:hypothetical protein